MIESARPNGLDLGRFDLPGLLAGCLENLLAVYDERTALFPYSTRLVDGRFDNDYEHPQAIRYTINTLLGLSEAVRSGTPGVGEDAVRSMTEGFLDCQLERIETAADLGLLTLLLTEYGDGHDPIVSRALDRMDGALTNGGDRLNMQDLAWMIWGACSASRQRLSDGERVAAIAFGLVEERFVEARSGLPRHSTRRYRRGIVSFGSFVYFLRAMHEYAATFSDQRAEQLFERGVQAAIDVQGPLGEWPWMLDVRSGKTFDVYPVFSVHQDSMAMLFLLPARDRGAARADEAIVRSFGWGFGANELSIDFYRRDPFHAYRSIERVESAPRLRRYTRGLSHSISGRPATFGGSRVRLNRECRSYHLGWILFAWASRPEARLVTGLSRPTSDQADDR